MMLRGSSRLLMKLLSLPEAAPEPGRIIQCSGWDIFREQKHRLFADSIDPGRTEAIGTLQCVKPLFLRSKRAEARS